MATKELKDIRKQMFGQMEQQLNANRKPEDSFFYYHSSEDRIVLSHALFWVMTQSIKGHIAKEKYFMLLRQYQEEMLSAYLTESDEFPELLHYCNVIYETLPIILKGVYDLRIDKDARRLAAIAIVAGGYGGDMPEEQCYDLLDDSLGINWKKATEHAILSEKDTKHALLKDFASPLVINVDLYLSLRKKTSKSLAIS